MQHLANTGHHHTAHDARAAAASDVSRGMIKDSRAAEPPFSLKAEGLVPNQTHKAGRLLPSAALVLLFVMLMIAPCAGEAFASWPVQGEPEVTLAYKESYRTQAGNDAVHRGVDCAASAGETVTSPVGGTVSFAGSVPAGEVEGCGTTLAVSVALPDGKTLTLMPFDEIWVSVGDELGEGAPVGRLAASGDRSSELPHLHVGLKMEGVYYDPLPLLGIAPAPVGDLSPGDDRPSLVPVEAELPAAASGEAVAEQAGVPFEGLGTEAGCGAAPVEGFGLAAEPPVVTGPDAEAVPAGHEVEAAGAGDLVVSSGEGAYESWQDLRRVDAAEPEEEPEGFLEGLWRHAMGLYGKVVSLVASLVPGLADIAPAVAAIALLALGAAIMVMTAMLLRTPAARRVRGRVRTNMERGVKALRLKFGGAKALESS